MLNTKRKITHALPLVFIAATLFACSSSQSRFSKKDVKRSQKIIGVNFDKKYIDTLHPYLQRNKEGFDSLRKYTLDNNVFPAVRFDPLPLNFTPKQQTGFPDWGIPEDVHLPDKRADLAFYTIPQLASLIKSKKISSYDLTEFFIERLKKYNPILQCTITITEEMALEQAKSWTLNWQMEPTAASCMVYLTE